MTFATSLEGRVPAMSNDCTSSFSLHHPADCEEGGWRERCWTSNLGSFIVKVAPEPQGQVSALLRVLIEDIPGSGQGLEEEAGEPGTQGRGT